MEINTHGISNIYIEELLRPLTTKFIGVFSANNLPKNLIGKKHFSLICNHDNIGEAGSHFISIFHYGFFLLYIDSFGQPCAIDDIQNFLLSFQLPVFYNSRQVQSINSSFCGFFCILFVLYFDQLFNFAVFPSKLFFNSVNLSVNDMLCIDHILKLLKA